MCGYSYCYRVEIKVATLPINNAIEFEKVNLCVFITASVLENITVEGYLYAHHHMDYQMRRKGCGMLYINGS